MRSVTMTPVARKEHQCDLCDTKIMPGETYVNQRVFGDGTAWTTKMHLDPCDQAFTEYLEEVGTDTVGLVQFDWVRGWANDHAGLYDSAAALYRRMNND